MQVACANAYNSRRAENGNFKVLYAIIGNHDY